MSQASANEAFVREYQARRGLKADGWAGVATLADLDALLPPVETRFDPAAFFASVKASFGPLSQAQVDGFNAVLDATKGWPVSWIAYGLATTWHETARTMQPIKEHGGEAYFTRMYDPKGERPHVAARLGNIHPGDGARYAGRGYVQLTGRTNYARYGIDDSPDDAMKPDVAGQILRDGMENGRFTGKKLSDYLPGDYVNARRIINGTDKAQTIAGQARAFEAALRAGGMA
ncbi:MAG: hypothetical protein V7672_00670 [Brevundimonas sp.]|uniref:hypothetical protein n=1 Tax=Brevundimonas sp. TaxID=1871086 RepID=UPI0030039C34